MCTLTKDQLRRGWAIHPIHNHLSLRNAGEFEIALVRYSPAGEGLGPEWDIWVRSGAELEHCVLYDQGLDQVLRLAEELAATNGYDLPTRH